MSATVTTQLLRRTARVAAERSALVDLRDELADALTGCDWSDEDIFRVLVCADEAMANALTHGSAAGGAITIRFTVTDARAVLLVADGHTCDAEIQTPAAPPDESSEHGRGLILMHALADTFRVRQHPAGTIVALAFLPEALRATKGDAR